MEKEIKIDKFIKSEEKWIVRSDPTVPKNTVLVNAADFDIIFKILDIGRYYHDQRQFYNNK